MTIKPHGVFSVITPDEVAECWDGVGDLYSALWECVPEYDNSYRDNIEDIGPHDVIGINAVSNFWHKFTTEQRAKLNELATAQEGEWPDD